MISGREQKAFFSEIKKAQNILIIIHAKPDGDTTGSGCALANYLELQKKQVKVFCSDSVPRALKFIPGSEKVSSDQNIFEEKFDLIIFLDCSDLKYPGVKDLIPIVNLNTATINIDHHKTNLYYADLNIVDSEISSTAEILTKIFFNRNVVINQKIATGLLTGIITDTGGFNNPATSQSALQSAGGLLLHGANLNQVIQNVFRSKSLPMLKFWGVVFSRICVNKKFSLAYTYIKLSDFEEYQITEEAIEGLANFFNGLSDINIGLVLKEQPGNLINCSLRTTKNNIDVSALAGLFGGGGHQKASGFTVKGCLKITESGVEIE